MEGTVGFLLLTLLATAATATYEYHSQLVQSRIDELLTYTPVGYELFKTHGVVGWNKVEKRDGNVYFTANPQLYTGTDCNEKPALILYDGPTPGPTLCLAQMNFITTTDSTFVGRKILNLVLGFVESGHHYILTTVFFDLWKKPSNAVPLLPGVVEAVPMKEPDLMQITWNRYLKTSASWLDNIFKRGIYKFTLNPEEFPSIFKGYPIVVNPKTLDRILAL